MLTVPSPFMRKELAKFVYLLKVMSSEIIPLPVWG